MIIVTGAAGFIGSAVAARFIEAGFRDLVLVDDFMGRPDKARNYADKPHRALLNRAELEAYIQQNERQIQFVIHLGARTDTGEKNVDIFDKLNLNYSKMVWRLCATYQIPLIYASSAATYGDGSQGFSDDITLLDNLRPLNPYAHSKHDFDRWAIRQDEQPYFWAGLKFFNVYGPNEYHKGPMASVIYHAYHQIKETGELKLFRSHRPDYQDGEQRRDFIYVKDVANVILHLMQSRQYPGIYNLGTGRARTFNDLAQAVFRALHRPTKIRYIDIPEAYREGYQYFTEAQMGKLRETGYTQPFTSLELGVAEYVQDYLNHDRVW